MNHIVIECALLAYIAFLEIRNYIERKKLIDRIMAKSYVEYAAYENQKEAIKSSSKESQEFMEL